MELSEAIRKRINNLKEEQKYTLHGLSLMAGVTDSTLDSFMKHKSKSINAKTLLHVCEGFQISLEEFFTDPLFDENAKEVKKMAQNKKTTHK